MNHLVWQLLHFQMANNIVCVEFLLLYYAQVVAGYFSIFNIYILATSVVSAFVLLI